MAHLAVVGSDLKPFVCCTSSVFLGLLTKQEVDRDTTYFLTDTHEIFVGNHKLDSGPSEDEINSSERITNCKCCGAVLPKTLGHFVECEYCGSIQDAYKKIVRKDANI